MPILEEVLINMEDNNSLFENEVRKIQVPVCNVFLKSGTIVSAAFKKTSEILGSSDVTEVNKAFPKSVSKTENKILEGFSTDFFVIGKRVAVLFSGGPAAGGHNVIVGLKKALGKNNTLLGVKNGPKGLIEGTLFEIEEKDIPQILNTGGFDFLGSDRTKIKTELLSIQEVIDRLA